MAENLPVLPQDLIFNEILLLLDVESIGRCRCVSKPWRRLLSSPEFVKAHLNRPKHDLGIILNSSLSDDAPYVTTLSSRGGDNDGVFRPVNCHLYKPNMWVEASCHGLVLFSHRDVCRVLVNPVTLEATQIPIRHSSDCSPMCGLGYDSFQDDYKIVLLSFGEGLDSGPYPVVRNCVDICSVRTKTWRRLAKSPYDHPQFGTGVFANGCIHWLGEGLSSPVISAINLAREEIEEIPFPAAGVAVSDSLELTDVSDRLELTAVNEYLAMLVFVSSKLVDVWVMKEYGVQDSWIKIGIDHDHPDGGVVLSRVICIQGDEILVRNGNRLVAYDWKNRVWKDLLAVPQIAVSCFRPSLVSPIYE